MNTKAPVKIIAGKTWITFTHFAGTPGAVTRSYRALRHSTDRNLITVADSVVGTMEFDDSGMSKATRTEVIAELERQQNLIGKELDRLKSNAHPRP